MGGLSYNKSRGGLQNRKLDSFTAYKTLETKKTKAGERKEFIYDTRKPSTTVLVTVKEWFTAEFPYLSPWQIYLHHTPQTAAQDLQVSSCTGEVFSCCYLSLKSSQTTYTQQLWAQPSEQAKIQGKDVIEKLSERVQFKNQGSTAREK